MKRILTLFLCFCLLVSIAGCAGNRHEDEAVRFYYCVTDSACFDEGTVIQWENRSGLKKDDLLSLLRFYLAGPQSAQLRSPFPDGLQILSAEHAGTTLHLTVSLELCALSDFELTLACGCLTLTCLELTDAQQVTITPEFGLLDGQRSITMDKNTLLLQIDQEGE